MRRGFFNVNFRVPGFSFPEPEAYLPAPEITDDQVYYYFERLGGTRYRLNRARTSYGELRADGMFMNYGNTSFTGYTASGQVSGTDQINQTRFTMSPTAITLKSKGSDHFRVTDHARVLTNLVVDNSTLTKTLTTQLDTTTNSLSVTTFTRTDTLSVHNGSSTRFLNVSAHTNTHTLSVKDLTTTKTLSTLEGTYSWWLNVSAHTNTHTLSVKDLTTTKTLSVLEGTSTWWLNVSAHTNTHTLSVKDHTTTDFLDVLHHTKTDSLYVDKHTDTGSLYIHDSTDTDTLTAWTQIANFGKTDLNTLKVYGESSFDDETTFNYTAKVGTTGTSLFNVTKHESGAIEVNGEKYYSAPVVDHIVSWMQTLGQRAYQAYIDSWQYGYGNNYDWQSQYWESQLNYVPGTSYIQQSGINTPYQEPPEPTPFGNCTRWRGGLYGVEPISISNNFMLGSVTGTLIGRSVWGTNNFGYTDDSDFARAAVHAGLVSVGQTLTLKFTNLGTKSNFPNSSQNGITTSIWPGSWCAIQISNP